MCKWKTKEVRQRLKAKIKDNKSKELSFQELIWIREKVYDLVEQIHDEQ
jgi:hypothetical protein